MEIEQDRGGAHIASPVAWGYGPALAMPTLMGMMGEQEEADAGQDGGQVSGIFIASGTSYACHNHKEQRDGKLKYIRKQRAYRAYVRSVLA